MASDDPLSMSLDDIIKSRRQGRRGGRSNQRGRGRGKARGRGNINTGNTEQYSFSNNRQGAGGGQGGGQGGAQGGAMGGGRGYGNRGRGRGVRLLTTKFGVRGASRVRGNSTVLQGNRLGMVTRGGRGYGGRGRDLSNNERRGRIRDSIIQRIRTNRGQQPNDFQMRDVASTSSSNFARRRLQQPQRSSSDFQQLKRSKARKEMFDQRRGIAVGMKTSGNLGAPLRVRVGSGTIVRGLRSDQLLLQKFRQSQKPQAQARLEKYDAIREKRDRSQNRRDSSLESNSIVSLSSHRGLTVSIKNDIASHSLHNGTTSRSRPRLNKHKPKKNQDMFAPATFTIVNDHVNLYDSDFEMLPDPTRRTKRNIITARDPRARNTVPLSIGVDNMRALPEPHRQILDPKIQKEIAMLQGKDEVTLNSGPGPGVKGFRHVPSQTTRSLNERFTNERLVTV